MTSERETVSIGLIDPDLGRAIDEFAYLIPDPVQRLRFVRGCGTNIDERRRALLAGPFRKWATRLIVIDSLSRGTAVGSALLSGRDQALLGLYRASGVAERLLRWTTPRRLATLSGLTAAAALLIVGAVALRPEAERPAAAEVASPKPKPAARPIAGPPLEERAAGAPLGEVWLVESEGAHELYSNGLSISNEFLTRHEPRRFPLLRVGPGLTALDSLKNPDWRTDPVGIVYHTTVSETVPPLERENNNLIRYRGRQLLGYIAREKLYNFVIDRFGRVFRIIAENEYAFHAGYSIWGRGAERYFNLNESFIGVAFETRPEALDPDAPPEATVRPAQVAAARLLTQMLRDRFGIPTENCVAHEMVSLSPATMLIGYHTDWAGRFPFEALGLPDNYQTPPPAVGEWGFRQGDDFKAALGGWVWPGVKAAERRFRREAEARGISVEEHRRRARQEYRRLLEEIKALKARTARTSEAGA